MSINIFHISDIHHRSGWEENVDLVLRGFFDDLAIQLKSKRSDRNIICISGDLVNSGDKDSYNNFYNCFDNHLNDVGFDRSSRIVVPGNHDVCRPIILGDRVNYSAIEDRLSSGDEKSFNDYIRGESNIIKNKFIHYVEFENKFSSFGVKEHNYSGYGHELSNSIGVYCLNSAVLSSGGIDGNEKEKLAVDTRGVAKWISDTKYDFRILVMHHPVEWLNQWSCREIKKIINKSFGLVLYGHSHDQSIYFTQSRSSGSIFCAAPPLFTSKNAELGYSYVTISNDLCVQSITYRQWSRHHHFVSGSGFSGTDTGVFLFDKRASSEIGGIDKLDSLISKVNAKKLDDALRIFSDQPKVEIFPVLYERPENQKDEPGRDNDKAFRETSITDIVYLNSSVVIKAHPQFGLTCLSLMLIKKAWEIRRSFWIRLEADNIKPHNYFKDHVEPELNFFDLDREKIDAIVIDCWDSANKMHHKTLKRISDDFPGVRIVILETIGAHGFFKAVEYSDICDVRNFECFYMRSLKRSQIRDIVSQYNSQKVIHESDDVVLKRLASDLDVLNLHRTPLNCITLLKAAENRFDDSPVNRTEVLHQVLFLLFSNEEIPGYKTRPDLKDCEHVLGWFCENILRANTIKFSRDHFFGLVNGFASKNLIDLDSLFLFEILQANGIIVKSCDDYCFRFTYWIMYFAAHRMHHSKEFFDFIFSDTRYADYPELIEFYTGIDRRRGDALSILIRDLESIYLTVKDKCGFPDDFNIYNFAKWNPAVDTVERIQNELQDGVLHSNLPDIIKDEFSDRSYDPSRPYNQDINAVIKEYLFDLLTKIMSAASRALRNSDYVDPPEIKRNLLDLIIRCWDLVTKIVLVMSPILAKRGRAIFEGSHFQLVGNFGKDDMERFNTLVRVIPENIVSWYQGDLYSPKMGTLLFDYMKSSKEDMKKHYIALLLIEHRPEKWKSKIENYISEIHKNSFYLLDIEMSLSREQKYGYHNKKSLEDIIYLRKMAWAKHKTGVKYPTKKLIDNVSITERPELDD